ncbi:hypothetical protein V8Z74_24915 [Comamonas sp. w2-DMI]|uniref:hypothetical protein n=1 Tax=Comamonas sp. w2-DMI TaxID=3126391 RepID=UPI0032E3F49E
MVCFESIFAGLRQVYFFEETITLSDRKPESLNFLMVEPRGMRGNFAEARLSLDNLWACADTGGY